MREHQYPLPLPAGHPVPRRRDDADRLREQLAALIEELNGTTCPAQRIDLHHEAEELRARLAIAEGSK
jgi:hypothetical protein